MPFGAFSVFAGTVLLVLFSACGTGKNAVYKPGTKLAGDKLREDYQLLRRALEKEHPSIYWYTPKAVMDSVFDAEYRRISDSMSHIAFRNVLARTVDALRCGHTSVSFPKPYERYINRARLSLFPIGMRLWGDTMVSTYNLYRKDTLLKRGTIIKGINGMSTEAIRRALFATITTDGYADNFKNIRISGNFPYNHFLVFDTAKKYSINYIDSAGTEKQLTVDLYRPPPPDTSRRIVRAPVQRVPRREIRRLRRESIRNLRIDTAASVAYFDLSSFSGGRQKKFFRQAFKTLRKQKVEHLVIDVRNNGGGLITNAISLSKYITDHRFKIADTVFANAKFSQYNRYLHNRFWYGVSMIPLTRKRADGKYHFGWWERHYYRARGRNHFNGKVYCITGGYSFSATTLFLNVVRGQQNVTLVGEETGGGEYGNSAVFLPEFKLPYSKFRVRLPVFRLVTNKNFPKGRGIHPDIWVPPTIATINKQIDNKMQAVKALIEENRAAASKTHR